MKTILMSIHPEYCYKIFDTKEKTIEIRKCPKSRDICYWKGLKSKRLIRDLIAAGWVEEITQ